MVAKTDAPGWLSSAEIGGHDTYHQVIRRLKRHLNVDGIDPGQLLENSGAKQYRFSVPPGNVSVDRGMVERHVDGAGAVLASLALQTGAMGRGHPVQTVEGR